MSRSPEAKRRRAHDTRHHIAASGRRVNCESCRMMHPPPGCPDEEWEQVNVSLPPRLARLYRTRVPLGQRSRLVARLLWKELG